MILLTDEEIGKAVSDWVDVASSTRSVRLGRAYWEDIAPVIAQALAQRMVEWLETLKCQRLISNTLKLLVDCEITPKGNYEIKPYWRGFLAKQIRQALKEELKAEVKDV